MSKYLKLPIKISSYDDKEWEQYEQLGLEVPNDDGIDGIMYTNPDHIVGFVEDKKDTESKVDLSLSSGARIIIQMEFNEFLKLVDDK